MVSEIKQKNLFEQALEKLDLQGTLALMTVLSERALFLNSQDILKKKSILKPKLL